jgi:mRNA-degrading endonuclease toxin of MazEF toxin-antitoxin module
VLRLVKRFALVASALLLLASSAGAGGFPHINWHASRSLGQPWDGRLVHGVQLPAQGRTFFTWDPALRRKPNRPWRRWGNERLVRIVLRVLSAYAAAHPHAARVGVGDLSRPQGGNFGPQFGGLGHVSHQNGLDVDVYYPRKDRRELAPTTVAQVDQRLAQGLVNGFVAAGATNVFVGPHLHLHGPRPIVEPLPNHDNHLHVRIPNPVHARSFLLGRSVQGRPIRAIRLGDPASERRLLVVGCIHGNETAGIAVARLLTRVRRLLPAEIWVIPTLNPDGEAHETRQNTDGVDLNRNFPSRWRPDGVRGGLEYPGPRPLSEPETRLAVRFIRRIRPDVTIWFHQPQDLVRAWGRSIPAARRYARLAGLRFRPIPWPHGTAPNWQNHRFRRGASFVVELPPGRPSSAVAARQVRAILAMAKS